MLQLYVIYVLSDSKKHSSRRLMSSFFQGFCVRFEQTMYQVVESKEKVEVCVITCSDIRKQGVSDKVIRVIVFGKNNVPQIPRGYPQASKCLLILYKLYKCIVHILPIPFEPYVRT